MGGDQDVSRNRSPKSLTRERKLTVGVLLVCGLVMFVLAVVQVRRALNRPFTASLDEFIAFQRSLGPSDAEKERKQKETDTDGEGISDWAELNVYHTSPYLADTDSDGVPDNIEIARGTDPNCAEGKICASVFGGTEVATSTASAEGLGATAPATAATPGVPPRDPDAIRTFLRMRGMSDSELSTYADDALLKAYDAAAMGTGSLDSNGSSGSAQTAEQNTNSSANETVQP